MQIIKLNLDNDSFYCPATGQHIQGPQHFEPSPALVAGWQSDYLEEPLVIKGPIAEQFKAFCKKLGEEESYFDEDLEKFLLSVETPNLCCFEISSSGIACGPHSSTVWFVINFDYQK
jgi:hypothetical protein